MLLANGLVRLRVTADYEAHPQQAAAREYIVHAGKEMCGYFNEPREWPRRAEHRVWSEFTAKGQEPVKPDRRKDLCMCAFKMRRIASDGPAQRTGPRAGPDAARYRSIAVAARNVARYRCG